MLPPEIPPLPPIPAPYEDRKTGLMVFGVINVLLGILFALLVPFTLLALAIGPKQNIAGLVPGVVMYGGLSVVFITLGVGSMKARRWARALLLIFAWGMLVAGAFGMVFATAFFPKIVEASKASIPAGQPVPPMDAIMAVVMVFMFVFMVILPGVWVLFYRSPHVKATCDVEDPVERWTDRCPLPVLAVSLWLAFAVPMMLVTALGYRGVIPFFGSFVTGPLGSILYLLLAGLWAYSAFAIYKLKWSGWWTVTVSLVLFAVSAFLTYSRRDITELYTLMGFPEDQIALMKKYAFMDGRTKGWTTAGSIVPVLGYLLFVRRYFVAARNA